MNPDTSYMLSADQIFTLFFIMFGPLRLMVPFAEVSQTLTAPQRTTLAFKSCGMATMAVVIGCLIGKSLLFKWHVEVPILMMAAGIVFFLSGLVPMAFPALMAHTMPKTADARSVAFNMIITPFGMGAAIVLLAMSHDMKRTMVILFCFLGNILLDFIAMVYGPTILKYTHRMGLQILNISLGILGIALGLEIIVQAIRKI